MGSRKSAERFSKSLALPRVKHPPHKDQAQAPQALPSFQGFSLSPPRLEILHTDSVIAKHAIKKVMESLGTPPLHLNENDRNN